MLSATFTAFSNFCNLLSHLGWQKRFVFLILVGKTAGKFRKWTRLINFSLGGAFFMVHPVVYDSCIEEPMIDLIGQITRIFAFKILNHVKKSKNMNTPFAKTLLVKKVIPVKFF